MDNRVPITLITGYLGSGKTSLINHILFKQDKYKVAVIVNDIGEVNIDADLLERNGQVTSKDDSLVALTNGCICCSLKVDLINQLVELIGGQTFDYIVIEASGVCEPIPIVQSIAMLDGTIENEKLPNICRLDNVVSVVDAKRLVDEFLGGNSLIRDDIEEYDIESLIIQQIEFCNTIVLNKVSSITSKAKEEVLAVVRKLQPEAKIIETDYSKVDVSEILNAHAFDLDKVENSPGWKKLYKGFKEESVDEEQKEHHHSCCCQDENQEDHENCKCNHAQEESECGCECHHHEEEGGHHYEHHHEQHHEHHHHGHHHHGHHHRHDGETDEYGIGNFLYYARRPFYYKKFEEWVNTRWRENIIRCKGILWFSDERDEVQIFEQAGKQIDITTAGYWVGAYPKEKQEEIREKNPRVFDNWDETYGDRVIKLVFIGKNLNKEAICKELEECLGI